jgi:hypothetical protein
MDSDRAKPHPDANRVLASGPSVHRGNGIKLSIYNRVTLSPAQEPHAVDADSLSSLSQLRPQSFLGIDPTIELVLDRLLNCDWGASKPGPGLAMYTV